MFSKDVAIRREKIRCLVTNFLLKDDDSPQTLHLRYSFIARKVYKLLVKAFANNPDGKFKVIVRSKQQPQEQLIEITSPLCGVLYSYSDECMVFRNIDADTLNKYLVELTGDEILYSHTSTDNGITQFTVERNW